jgi:hypothetical protein
MKLFYDDILLGEIMTNHSMTVDEALDCLGIDMDEYASEQGWDDWDWFALRMEY